MNKYELTVVLSVKLEEEERAAVMTTINNYITRYEGTVVNVEECGKKKLAYEIQKMKEAYYYFVTFEGTSNTPNELEQQLRIMEPVVRYLTVRADA